MTQSKKKGAVIVDLYQALKDSLDASHHSRSGADLSDADLSDADLSAKAAEPAPGDDGEVA